MRLYDIKSSNPNPIMQFEGHTNNITGVAFHCEGKWMVTSSEDMTVRVWDTRSGMVQRNYQHSHPVNDVVIHPNQGELVSCDRGGNIRIWDLGESKCTHQLVPVEDVSMASVSVASDGSLLAAGNNLVSWAILRSSEQPLIHDTGRRVHLADVSEPRLNYPPAVPSLQSPQRLPYPPPSLTRHQTPCNMQRRSHSTNLEDRHE